MRAHLILLPALLAGCATQQRLIRTPASEKPAAAVPERTATRLVETRYELRDYHDASDPAVRHEGHAIHRATLVPVRPNGPVESLATVPRTTYPPVSYAPLPQAGEVAAELATQKQITSDLRAIQASMSATQKGAEAKFDELVNQTAETVKLRRELEAERARVRQLETSLRDQPAEVVKTASSPLAKEANW